MVRWRFGFAPAYDLAVGAEGMESLHRRAMATEARSSGWALMLAAGALLLLWRHPLAFLTGAALCAVAAMLEEVRTPRPVFRVVFAVLVAVTFLYAYWRFAFPAWRRQLEGEGLR